MARLPRRLRTVLTGAVAITAATATVATAAPATSVPSAPSLSQGALAGLPGLSALRATGTPSGRAIVTLDAVPTGAVTDALAALGLEVQPMQQLPMAVVEGPVAAMTAAVTSGLATDVYPDERIELLDTASSDETSSSARAARALRSRGLTGEGVTVGVVDSGCDATHPDLADHVTHNVTLVSGEYANVQPDSSNTLVVPVDQGPRSDTDLGSGHGTHVAGIIAADSTSADDGSRLGVAPDAELACFGIGQVLFTTAVVTAYDYMLDQPDMLGIDVVNNSWGNSYRQYDPRDPVNVATRAVTDEGATVVFAAGNSGSDDVEATLNPFSQAPWVISVAAATLDRTRGDFSSNGLRWDNSTPTTIGAGGHTVFRGDRLGVVHPDVSAPGVDVSSTCASTGALIGPCPAPDNAEASGTSMASPHVAGAAAVLLQARPGLSATQVRRALEATATTVTRDDGTGARPFWQVGHGHVNLDRAVALVSRDDWRSAVAERGTAADARALRGDRAEVARGDFFSYDVPRGTVAGTDTRTFGLPVVDGVDRLHVSLAHPSAGTVGANLFSYTATVRAPSGRVLGTTTESPTQGAGTATVTLDLRALKAPAGRYTVKVVGEYAASDPDTVDSDSVLGRTVTLHVAQLR